MSLLSKSYAMQAQPAEVTLAVLNQALPCQRKYGDESQPSPHRPWDRDSVHRWLKKNIVFFLKAVRHPQYHRKSCLCQLATGGSTFSDRMTRPSACWPRGWQIPWGRRGGSGSCFVGSECSSLLCAICSRESHYAFPTLFQWTLAFNR